MQQPSWPQAAVIATAAIAARFEVQGYAMYLNDLELKPAARASKTEPTAPREGDLVGYDAVRVRTGGACFAGATRVHLMEKLERRLDHWSAAAGKDERPKQRGSAYNRRSWRWNRHAS